MANGTNNNSGGGSRTLLVILILAVLAAIAAYALGLFNINQTRKGALPSVEVKAEGGALPSFDADVADIKVEAKDTTVEVPTVQVNTKKTTVEVPTVSVEKAK